MASFVRNAAYLECVMCESRTLQSTASVWSGVMYRDQSSERTASYNSSGEVTVASRIGRSTRMAVRSQRLAR